MAIPGLILYGAVAAAWFGGAASAQQAPAESTVPLQEVIVTGSLLKRTDTETPSPVQLISAQDLKNSGYTNVSDILRNLAANGQGTLNQAFPGAVAAGATGIALRGLTVGDTLTLIDSERMVAYPLSDDGERSFVDVTAIPFNAIDSVEVLKDGASALYGADAIAGVVNIKLKQTYVGSQIVADGGATQHNDGWTWHASGILGWGDLGSDRYNVYLALDWHREELILGSDRNGPFTTLDWSHLPEGVNQQPGAVGAAGLTYPDSVTGYLINPNTTTGQPYAFLPGCTQAEQNAQKCTFAFPGQIQPPTEQTNFIAKFTKALDEHWRLTLTTSIFDSSAEQVGTQGAGHAFNNTGQEAGAYVNITVNQNGGSFVSYPVLSLPANSPQNPFGVRANLVYAFPDIGPEVTDVQTETYRFFADLKGTAGGWDLNGSVGFMYAKMHQTFNGYIEPGVAQQDLNSLTYVPGVSTNGSQLFAPQESIQPTSTLDVADVHGVRDLLQMSGGPLTLAAGAQYFHKAQNVPDPPSVASGVQHGVPVWSIGSQDDVAGFLEVGGKIFEQLEANAAVRYDHYDTYGGQATPKFGLKYTPIDWFTARGTWGKGFRAPSISEAGNAGLSFYEGNTFDPVLCPGGTPNVKGTFNALCAYPVVGVAASNPQLKAVTSENATFGVIFEPSQAFNVSADYYHIQLTNDIISASAAGGLNAHYISLIRGPPAESLVCTATVMAGTCPQELVETSVGYPAYQTIPYVNAGITTTSGFDIDMRGRFDMGNAGSLLGDINWTHILQYEYGYQGTTFDLVGTHGPTSISGNTGNPRDRAVASLTWLRGPFTTTMTANYTSSFHITDPSAGYNTCLQSLQARIVGPYGPAISGTVTTLPSAWYPFCSVAHFTDFNLYASYEINEHLGVHGSITNVFNSDAPVDVQTYGGGGALAYDAALHQDGAVGRFFLLGGTLKF
ncbi:MAG: TonB-dependent receptor plug domain-containing protein [Steroidobacteraceae bacterium]